MRHSGVSGDRVTSLGRGDGRGWDFLILETYPSILRGSLISGEGSRGL